MENKLDSGFQIKDLILVESSFRRIGNVSFEKDVNKSFNVNVESFVNDNTITVAVEATVAQKLQDIEQFNIRVKMIGIFEHIGDTLITDFERFGKVNGAAIIFPYIREHVTNLSSKAGMGAILLPPVNFTKMPEKQQA